MGSCRCALPEEGTTGNPSSVRAVEMQRGQEGRRPGVTRSPGLLLLQYPWLGDNRALHEMPINQKNSEGHNREHKLLGVSKGLCSAFLQ